MNSFTDSKLADLPGLQNAKVAITRLARLDSAVHAVLLYGASGVGKRKLADELAAAWLCTGLSADGACGDCQSCIAFQRDRSADFLPIIPRPPSNIIRVAAISGDQTHPDDKGLVQLVDFFRSPPLVSRNKVVLIQDADRMSGQAANALLKTLEEPPPRCRLLLTTSAIGQVPLTIVSRCVTIACEAPVSTALEVSEPWQLLASEASPGILAEVMERIGPYGRIAEIADSLNDLDVSAALAVSERFRSACDELQQEGGDSARQTNVEALRALGACLSRSHRADWLTLVAETHRRIQGNAHDGIALDAMFAKMLAPS